MIESGAISPRVDRVFPLEEAPRALDYLDSGDVKGKIVIEVG